MLKINALTIVRYIAYTCIHMVTQNHRKDHSYHADR